MNVGVSKGKLKGKISYNKENKEFIVDFPDSEVKTEVTKYLSTKREFRIPESQRIDDYRIDKVLPTENQMYFDLTLSQLYGAVGVYVHWDTEEV